MAVLHHSRIIVRKGHVTYTTLCGRMNKKTADGMNIAARREGVTCKFCLKQLAALESAEGR